MDSSASVGGKLPVEIIERVLSFLPVPVLCRMRCVCKTWNEIIGRPSFHDLYDLNGKNNLYLSLWGNDLRGFHGFVAPIVVGTLSFLDLNAKRWYSIQAIEIHRFCACISDMESRLMAMEDGLVWELTSSQDTESDRNFVMTLTDPVAKTRRILPAPPTVYSCSFDDSIPLMVPVVDDVTRSYKTYRTDTEVLLDDHFFRHPTSHPSLQASEASAPVLRRGTMNLYEAETFEEPAGTAPHDLDVGTVENCAMRMPSPRLTNWRSPSKSFRDAVKVITAAINEVFCVELKRRTSSPSAKIEVVEGTAVTAHLLRAMLCR